MKRNLLAISNIALALALTFGAVACQSDSDKTAKPAPKATAASTAGLPNYRYVDHDTILARYNLAKDYNEEMLRLQTNFENTARQKDNAIRQFENTVNQKMQNNGYLSEASLKQDQQKYVSMQNAAQNELSKMQTNMQNVALEAQKTVNDSIDAFIRDYNASRGYDAIFFKAATIYIDPRLDITDEVIEGLNARYNKVKK